MSALASKSYAQSVGSITFQSGTISAGANTNATIQISAAAPVNGFQCTLSASNANISFPNLVVVPSGATSLTFRVSANPVLSAATSRLNVNGTAFADLNINPQASYTTVVSEDAFINWPQPLNWGTSNVLIAKNGLDSIRRASFLKFDLTNVTVAPVSATLRLTQPYSANNGTLSIGCYSVPDTTWTETTITGTNAPSLQLDSNSNMLVSTGTLRDTQTVWFQPVQNVPGPVSFDVTSFIQANIGHLVTLQLVSLTQSNLSLSINSRETGGSTAPALMLSFNAPALTAQVVSSSQATLTWNDPTTTRDGYEIERKDGGSSTWNVIYSTEGAISGTVDTYLAGGANFSYRMRGFTGSTYTAYSNQVNVSTNAGDTIPNWGYLAAYPTGASSIRLYWPTIANATQFQVFRATDSGQYNYLQPLATLPGTAHYFDDTNLIASQQYYYIVRVSTSDNKHADSSEDNATPDVNAIPWNGTSSQIFQKAYQLASSNIADGEIGLDVGNLRIMAPDACIYIYGTNSALPPDGSVDYLNGQMTLSGLTTVMPILETTSLMSSPASHLSGGTVRRAVSSPSLNNQSVTGIKGTFYVPNKIDYNGFQYFNFPAAYTSDSKVHQPVTGHCYIGTYDPDPGIMIDAGVQYNIANFPNSSYQDRWRVFLRISDGRPLHGYVDSISFRANGGANSVTAGTSGLQAGYYIDERLNIIRTTKIVLFRVTISDIFGIFFDTYFVDAAKTAPIVNRINPITGQSIKTNFNNPRMKRVVSTDDDPDYLKNKVLTPFVDVEFKGHNIDPFLGTYKDSTYFKNIYWLGGMLYTQGTGWLQWSQFDTTSPEFNYLSKYSGFSGPITLSPSGGRPYEEIISIVH